MLLPSGNQFKYHEEVLYVQPMIPPKPFDISPPDWGVLRRPRCVQILVPSACRLGKLVYDNNFFPSLVAVLSSWRYLATSISSFLHAAINLRSPSVSASAHTSASNPVAFQSPTLYYKLVRTGKSFAAAVVPEDLKTETSVFVSLLENSPNRPQKVKFVASTCKGRIRIKMEFSKQVQVQCVSFLPIHSGHQVRWSRVLVHNDTK